MVLEKEDTGLLREASATSARDIAVGYQSEVEREVSRHRYFWAGLLGAALAAVGLVLVLRSRGREAESDALSLLQRYPTEVNATYDDTFTSVGEHTVCRRFAGNYHYGVNRLPPYSARLHNQSSTTLEECKDYCREHPHCQAIEFRVSQGRCEIWYHYPHHYLDVEWFYTVKHPEDGPADFTCYIYNRPSTTTTTATTTTETTTETTTTTTTTTTTSTTTTTTKTATTTTLTTMTQTTTPTTTTATWTATSTATPFTNYRYIYSPHDLSRCLGWCQLDSAGCGGVHGAYDNAYMPQCNYGPDQFWQYDDQGRLRVQELKTGQTMCLQYEQLQNYDLVNAWLKPCSDASNQKFTLYGDPEYMLIKGLAGGTYEDYCLDWCIYVVLDKTRSEHCSIDNNNNVYMHPCHGEDNQQWNWMTAGSAIGPPVTV